jgi:hypothetical protein
MQRGVSSGKTSRDVDEMDTELAETSLSSTSSSSPSFSALVSASSAQLDLNCSSSSDSSLMQLQSQPSKPDSQMQDEVVDYTKKDAQAQLFFTFDQKDCVENTVSPTQFTLIHSREFWTETFESSVGSDELGLLQPRQSGAGKWLNGPVINWALRFFSFTIDYNIDFSLLILKFLFYFNFASLIKMNFPLPENIRFCASDNFDRICAVFKTRKTDTVANIKVLLKKCMGFVAEFLLNEEGAVLIVPINHKYDNFILVSFFFFSRL